MHAIAATIYDAARRLEEADAVYRFKSRLTLEEFDELGGQWIDTRAHLFNARHVQPQRELIEQGARLRRMHVELVVAASTLEAVQTCKDLAARANTDSSRAEKEIEAIGGGIATASEDPGW